MLEEINQKYMMETIQYMTKYFPYRLSGSPCEAEAAEYVSQKMRAFGLEVENETFYTYSILSSYLFYSLLCSLSNTH